ncbi:MAG: cyclase family protein [Anaerotignaceae bacterium]
MIDITRALNSNIEIFAGDPPFSINKVYSIQKGDEFQVSKIEMGSHCGTHVDYPCHFYEKGKTSTDYPADYLCGKVVVLEVDKDTSINSVDFKDIKGILFKTKEKKGITLEVAEMIVDKNIKFVGINTLNIENYNNINYEVHKKLLINNVLIIEGLELSGVKGGVYNLYCLPIKIDGIDASPVRAILI